MANVIGSMDRLVTIRKPTQGQDSYGGPTSVFADFAQVWAEVKQLRGREFLEASQVAAGSEVEFRIHYRNDFDETAKVLHDGIEYEVLYVAEMGRRAFTRILAKKP